MVFNHTADDSPLNLLYRYDQNPYFSSDGNPWGFPDLNHWNDATKRLIKDIQDYWLIEFHIDGFRYDHVEGIRYDAESGAAFMTWAARQTKPHAYLIAEQLMDPVSVVRDTEMDASWHPAFHDVLAAQLREGEYHGRHYGDMQALLSVMSFRGQGYSDNAQAINYLECHDQDRICFDIQSNGLDHGTALRKARLGAVALFTAAGVPMLFHGQEFGMDTPKTTDTNKLQWERLDDPAARELMHSLGSLAQLRHDTPALQGNTFEPLLIDWERKILVFKRWNDGGSQVVVALNFAPSQQFAEKIEFPRAGRWHEWMFNYEEDFGATARRQIEMPGSGAKIWVAR
jgi:1,4-alpha-glucan branching enzyme